MIRLSDFSTLTFDCYGTLIHWEQGILNELRPWASRHGVETSDDELLEAFADAEAERERATPEKLYPEILQDVLGELADRWSVTLEDGEAEEFGRSVGRWPAFPDSPDTLAYLQQHFDLVILSNVDRASFAESEKRLGVSFDRVVTAEDIGTYKPNLHNFEYALDDLRDGLGVEPDDILHVAQSLFHDIVPAKKVGLTTVWINRRKGKSGWGATPPPPGSEEEARPDLELTSLAELAELHRSQAKNLAAPTDPSEET